MSTFWSLTSNNLKRFAQEDQGSQVVEYALIIALVSIVLVLALGNTGLGASFAALVTRVTNCFSATPTAC